MGVIGLDEDAHGFGQFRTRSGTPYAGHVQTARKRGRKRRAAAFAPNSSHHVRCVGISILKRTT